jgi:hypothetical protein
MTPMSHSVFHMSKEGVAAIGHFLTELGWIQKEQAPAPKLALVTLV